MGRLDNRRIAILIGPGFEESEALVPYYRLKEEGADVEVIGVGEAGTTIPGKHGVPMRIDRHVNEVSAQAYHALVIPGGRGPDAIRTNPDVIRVTKEFFSENRPVASICHGPQILINADVLKGVHMTAYQSVAQDVKNAGAVFEDRETVVDEGRKLVSARHPGDIPAWMKATIEVFSQAK